MKKLLGIVVQLPGALNFVSLIGNTATNQRFMYIFTDGITEIKNPDGKMLESEGFQNYIKKYQDTPNNERLKTIIDEILNTGHVQKDDLTIVVVDGS